MEFQNFGQEGLISVGNAHFQLVFDSVGDYRDSKPSGVQSCSFVNGFNTAIGLFGANGIEIYDNVVYKTVGNCKYHLVPGNSTILFPVKLNYHAFVIVISVFCKGIPLRTSG